MQNKYALLKKHVLLWSCAVRQSTPLSCHLPRCRFLLFRSLRCVALSLSSQPCIRRSQAWTYFIDVRHSITRPPALAQVLFATLCRGRGMTRMVFVKRVTSVNHRERAVLRVNVHAPPAKEIDVNKKHLKNIHIQRQVITKNRKKQ